MTTVTTGNEEASQVKKQTTQLSYKSSNYSDQSWEVVGEKTDNSQFEPSPFPVIGVQQSMADPMFADFGGRSPQQTEMRWHLPKNVAYRDPKDTSNDVVQDTRIKISAEDLEKLKKEAYAQGHSQGTADAELQYKQNIENMQQGLQTVMQDIGAQLTENLVSIERDSINLAMMIAEKIIGYAIEINPEYIEKLIKEALSHCGTAQIKKVRVSPQDMEFIQIVGLSGILANLNSEWKFERDESIHAGCVVETSAGNIDFQIDAAWQRMKDQIVKVTR